MLAKAMNLCRMDEIGWNALENIMKMANTLESIVNLCKNGKSHVFTVLMETSTVYLPCK